MDFGTSSTPASPTALGPQAIVFALAAIGLNMHFGYTGLLNFGQAGLHGGRRLRARRHRGHRWDLPFWVGIVVRLARRAALLALVLGVPTLRLRADYLAIVTIAAAEILRLVFGVGRDQGHLRRLQRTQRLRRAPSRT